MGASWNKDDIDGCVLLHVILMTGSPFGRLVQDNRFCGVGKYSYHGYRFEIVILIIAMDSYYGIPDFSTVYYLYIYYSYSGTPLSGHP